MQQVRDFICWSPAYFFALPLKGHEIDFLPRLLSKKGLQQIIHLLAHSLLIKNAERACQQKYQAITAL
jgi:hypothetical protein